MLEANPWKYVINLFRIQQAFYVSPIPTFKILKPDICVGAKLSYWKK